MSTDEKLRTALDSAATDMDAVTNGSWTGGLAAEFADCGGMAGDHEKSEPWTTKYDQNARDIVTLAATLRNALQRFGDVLAANGYNWWQSNRSTSSGAEPTGSTRSGPLYDSSGVADPAIQRISTTTAGSATLSPSADEWIAPR
ncbi:hypothetical protein [Nocardia sp. NPDC049526]|uniref:hypothetical protein n=1 Tax=Nocardia sp. NPDC049526 TaxID=3364316 RepID=UPI0037903F87